MTAGAEPLVYLAGRPVAQRTADAGAGGAMALFLVGLAINNNRGFGNVVQERRTLLGEKPILNFGQASTNIETLDRRPFGRHCPAAS